MRLSQTILSILALGCLTILVITNGSAQSNFWMQTNGPFGGDIRAIMADSAGNVFAGTNGSGVYRSINDGVTWAPTGSVQEFVYGLASDPSIGFLYEATSNGVGRSSDLGVTWSSASVPSRAGIRAVCVSSVTHTVFCASVGHGVYRSADTGTTWLTANVGLGDTLVWSLTYNPATGHLFAGTNDSGVFRSTDDGSTWVRVDTALAHGTILFLATASNGNIYAGSTNGVVVSTNDGSMWTIPYPDTVRFPRYTNAVLPAGGSGSLFAATPGSGVYHSSDQGQSWGVIDTGLTYLFVNSLCVTKAGTLLAGTGGGGIFRSINNGASWTESNSGLLNTFIISGATSQFKTFFAGSSTVGGYRTTDRGLTWVHLSLPAGGVPAMGVTKSGAVLVGSYGLGLRVSRDGGITWQTDTSLITYANVQSLAIDTSGNLYSGTDHGVYRSTNDGVTWTQRNSGLTDTAIISLAVNPANHYLWAATGLTGIFRSTNLGTAWTAVDAGLGSRYVSCLAVNTAGMVFAGTDSGVFVSTDNGVNWTPKSSGLTVHSILSLAVNTLGVVFAGTYSGVFSSADSANTWNANNGGLLANAVRSIVIDQTGFVYAGTDGKGVYRSILTTTSVSQGKETLPGAFSLELNYPNPFNPTTTIEFHIQSRSTITLKIFDVLGREVTTLINDVKDPGNYRVVWDASKYASGPYFCRLASGTSALTRKLLLIK